jgi:hypothetical protein
LGVFEGRLLGINLLLEGAGGLDRVLLILPAGGQGGVLLLQLGQRALHHLKLLAAALVLLLAQGLALDFELDNAAAQLVQLGRERVVLDSQAAGGLVDQVDGLVGQVAVGDVTV